ncbi:MAG: riboflavin synthase [Thermomicrobiales bacterium]|nr:riboflavin synthase [Thermomicrobiales bacterium]
MFTGIVEEIGHIERIGLTERAPLIVRCATALEGTGLGDSIAVNGVCLTVTELGKHSFRADVQPVTLRRSNLGALRHGDRVNLERSVAAGQRLGGHYVQGHVDGVGRIVGTTGEGPSLIVQIAAPPALLCYVVERGYVAVDGASLTVAELRPDGFDVSLVYHTQQAITLPNKKPGAAVNLEVDVVAKYVERLLGSPTDRAVNVDLLRRAGFA